MMNYGYNPYLNMQQFQQPQQQVQQQPQQVTYKAIPVTTKNEASSIIPDPSGTPILFINKGADEIYLKQVDTQTGLGVFKEYSLKPAQEEKPVETKSYEKDFKKLNEKLDAMSDIGYKLDNLKSTIEKGFKNAK